MKNKQAFFALALFLMAPINANNTASTSQPKANEADVAHIIASPEYKAIVKIMSKDNFLQTLSESTLHEVTKLANALTTLNDPQANFWNKGKAAIDLASAVTILYTDKKPTIYRVLVTLHNNINRALKNPRLSKHTQTILEIIAAKLKAMGDHLNDINNLGKLLTNQNHIKTTIQSMMGELIIIDTVVNGDPTMKAVFNAFLHEKNIKPMIKSISKKAATNLKQFKKARLIT